MTKAKGFWQQQGKGEESGFTLVEVALTIAMGLVIIAAAMTAFNVTKRNAITATQQNEAAAMKALVETAVARGAFPAWTNGDQVNRGLFSLVETANKNPYTGTARSFGTTPGIGVYMACQVALPHNITSPVSNPCTSGSTASGASAAALAGGFAFVHNATTIGTNSNITVAYNDGTTKDFQGWAFVETDMGGNVVAAVGGGIGGKSSS